MLHLYCMPFYVTKVLSYLSISTLSTARSALTKVFPFAESTLRHTVNQNIIDAPKIRNRFWISTNIAILDFFSIARTFSYRSSNYAIAKVVDLTLFASFFCIGFLHWFMASFLYWSLNSQDDCRSISIAKCKGKWKIRQNHNYFTF